jgi:YggT family protein
VNGILYLVYLILLIYGWMIVARALLSWIPVRPGTHINRVSGVLFQLTEPYLALFRRFVPIARIGGIGIDLSMLVGLVVLGVVSQLLGRL